MKNKKVFLVTGATGLLGSNIIEKLLYMDNVFIIALSHNKLKLKKMFDKYDDASLIYVEKDMRFPFDLHSILFNHPVDAVFHAAGPMSYKMINESPVDVINPNLIALTSILEGLVTQKHDLGISGRVVIFSSVTVYNGSNKGNDIIVNESDTNCSNGLDETYAVYSESKRMSEIIAKAYAKQYSIDIVIARLSTVYGATLFPPETAFFEFINNALLCKDIYIKNADLPKRDNIYIDDAVKGLFTILEKGKTGEAYNISSGGRFDNFSSIDEIAEIIAKITNEVFKKEIKVIYESPKSQFRKPGIILDNRKLESIGWKLSIGLYDGLKNTILKQAKY